MFRACFLFNPGADPFRFQRDEAAGVVQSMFPAIRGYVQTRALASDEPVAFSGSAELYFSEAEHTLAACEQGPGGLVTEGAAVHSCLAGMDRVVVRTPGYMVGKRVKGVYPFKRRPDLTIEAFQGHWWHTHGPIAALTESALSYVQVHPLVQSYERLDPHYDGITEITWPNLDAANNALVSRQMREDQGSDAPNFVDMESIALFMAEEETVLPP